jgi:hypothetical protein
VPLPSSARLATCIGLALSLQLTVAAGALAGPWALVPVAPAAPRPVEPVARAVDLPSPADGLLTLSAPGLWPGAVQLEPLSVDDDGVLQVPVAAAALGWWSAGPRPGEPGAAVVIGHVDLDGAPGIFARLADAVPGTTVVVGTGSEAVRFRVTAVDRYSKSEFPGDVVYRPTAEPELRLITCGGRFDRRTGHYEDNVVVRAVRA